MKHKWPNPQMVKVTRTNILILVGRSCHKKCSCFNIYCLVVKTNVKFLKKGLNVKVTRFITNSLALTLQKLLARLKFSKNGSNAKVKVTG